MARLKDYLDTEPARANREANHSEVDTPELGAPEATEADGPNVLTVDEPDKARLGPLGAFFKRRADFFEQEATLLAIQLERMWQDAAQPKE